MSPTPQHLIRISPGTCPVCARPLVVEDISFLDAPGMVEYVLGCPTCAASYTKSRIQIKVVSPTIRIKRLDPDIFVTLIYWDLIETSLGPFASGEEAEKAGQQWSAKNYPRDPGLTVESQSMRVRGESEKGQEEG
ncbi:MAG: hypothetical protein H0T73_06360 [Ardenticatenales bacterium]|nr:hypothetical protein [Ardenticatenales bacterium]